MQQRWAAFYMADPDHNASEAARKAGSRYPEDYAKEVQKIRAVELYLDAFTSVIQGRPLAEVLVPETAERAITAAALASVEEVKRNATEGMRLHKAAVEASRLGLYLKADGTVDLEIVRAAPVGAVKRYRCVTVTRTEGDTTVVETRAEIEPGDHYAHLAYTALNAKILGLDRARRRRPAEPPPTPPAPPIDQSRHLHLGFDLSKLTPETAERVLHEIGQGQAALPAAPGEPPA